MPVRISGEQALMGWRERVADHGRRARCWPHAARALARAGRREVVAIPRASTTSAASRPSRIAHPTIRRLQASTTKATYSQPSQVGT
jgi:hypothetical protein